MKITCCRAGTYARPNRKEKGKFIREFKNIEELAAFISQTNHLMYFPYIRTELTKKERITLHNKIFSLQRRRCKDG